MKNTTCYTFGMNTYIFRDTEILVSKKTNNIPTENEVQKFTEANLLSDIFFDKTFQISMAKFYASDTKAPDSDSSDDEKTDAPLGFQFIAMRKYFASHDERETALAARAKGLLNWRDATKFCAKCGASLIDDENATVKNCPSCKTQFFPRIEPCIIVLVTKGDEMLLVRHKLRIQNIYACVAGFIEIGESVEQAVAREVREECGIEIKDVRYCASQSWPFPDQLMLGFRAEYAGGELHAEEDELLEASWFKRDTPPQTPMPGSVAYRLISGEFDTEITDN